MTYTLEALAYLKAQVALYEKDATELLKSEHETTVEVAAGLLEIIECTKALIQQLEKTLGAAP